MKAVSGAALAAVESEAPEGFVPGEDDGEQACRDDAWQGEREEQMIELFDGAGAIHAGGFEDFARHFFEESVKHPDDDGQVEQRVDEEQAGFGIEQVAIAKDEVDGHKDADGGHHFGGEHPEQSASGALRGEEGHGVRARDGESEREEGRAERDDDAVPGEVEVAGAFGDGLVVGEGGCEEEARDAGDGFCFCLETGEDEPENREGEGDCDGPAENGDEPFVSGFFGEHFRYRDYVRRSA